MSQPVVPTLPSTEQLSEDTIQYLREKHVPELMEYLLRKVIREKPDHPAKFISDLAAKPLPPQIIIAGPPAGGKGTQCAKACAYIQKVFGRKPVHVSSGDLLREEVSNGTANGKIAESYMQSGKLVPDSLIINMIRRRLSQDDAVLNGWVLDGVPRTLNQAKMLDADGCFPQVFVVLDVPDEVLIDRAEGRRTDPATGKIYHLAFSPPPEDDAALMDRLEQRADDTREVLMPRVEIYHESMKGLLEFYGPITERVSANKDEQSVEADVIACLKKRLILP